MNDRLKAQLKGVQHPSALLRRQATLGVFALLLQAPQSEVLKAVLPDVLLACLTDTHAVGVADGWSCVIDVQLVGLRDRCAATQLGNC